MGDGWGADGECAGGGYSSGKVQILRSYGSNYFTAAGSGGEVRGMNADWRFPIWHRLTLESKQKLQSYQQRHYGKEIKPAMEDLDDFIQGSPGRCQDIQGTLP